MVQTAEKYYFKGQQVTKQTLNKLLKWGDVLSAIKSGSNSPDFLKERCGRYAPDNITAIRRAGYIITEGKGRHLIYILTKEGEQLIEDVKQHRKEKKNEQE